MGRRPSPGKLYFPWPNGDLSVNSTKTKQEQPNDIIKAAHISGELLGSRNRKIKVEAHLWDITKSCHNIQS